MFIVILTAVLGLMHLYLWKRLIRDTTEPGTTRRVLTAVLVGCAAMLIAALILPRVMGVTWLGWFAWPGYVWFALAAYLFLAALMLEPVRVLLRGWVRRGAGPATADGDADDDPAPPPASAVNRRLFLARASAVAAGAASVSLVGVGATRALGPPDLLQVPIRLRRLDPAFGGFRIAVISDIHLGPLAGRAHTERLVEMINGAEPDLVAIVGDLVDGSVAELGPAAEPLRDLAPRDGAFFVTGNHEYFVDEPTEWLTELDRLGLQVLRNENTAVRRGRAAFDLAGVNDLAGASRADPPDFDRALAGVAADRPTLLLAHQPIMVAQAAERGVDLQVSGHTHGGQMWPFHYAVRLAQPALAGLSTVEDTQLYVSRGAGFWGPPVRIGAPPDITILSLHPQD